ncbi:PRC-barrel domain-containing protein [Methylorubrum populi]|jgi:sporulation protein YlmC with PRC-barrel domain|uniref:PRC-barrel domain protein n=1 Tax=Methylorubrum populi (strain ATCC BAA-705 / NCIMB 13946 / BJ001) TaxID=441620 RepID=B1ZAY6_METPB|nr:PRC-barrel domain-containing protein [Methylorubrum populi]ACB79224.1 PRC-barrel domain protein [Methylorubrum populi BJ001]OAH27527.1 photosystem reaction center subunit H [Methylorubrum populi]PZP68097.1 MAG: PRC-barrel domain containing protein [Methylorubrum populi]
MTLRPLLCALSVLAGAPALAQEPAREPKPIAAQPATLNDDLRAKFVAQAPEDVVASKLIGTSIRNGANETIGSVADVVFDDKRAVKSYVVSVGGFLGLNAKYVAVAPETLILARKDGGRLDAVIETDKDQLRAAPEYVYLGTEPKK